MMPRSIGLSLLILVHAHIAFASESIVENPIESATALIKAASRGDLARVKELVDAGVDVNARDMNGKTALISAAAWDRLEIARFLLDSSAEVNARNNCGCTALFSAARWNHPEMVKLLIQAGAEINIKERNGFTPLHMAIRKCKTDCATLLCEKGAEYTLVPMFEVTPLSFAAKEGCVDICRFFVEEMGRDVNERNPDKSTPVLSLVMTSTCENCPQVDRKPALKYLISRGADCNLADDQGNMPVMGSIYSRDPELTRLLIEGGANPNLESHGVTPLTVATVEGFVEMVRVLLDHGADIHHVAKETEPMVTLSAELGNDEITRMLIEEGADVNATDETGATCLMFAASQGKPDLVE
ncbi:MAG: ankyrin repeat domain-containing protein, partial [Candidatus Omnitrophica bacterium]|nr:ankyrin repeat domain-containing protein [Candidatus Omnitrophota bacterium]